MTAGDFAEVILMKRRYSPWSFLCASVLLVEIILLVLARQRLLTLTVFWALTAVVGIVAALAIILDERHHAYSSRLSLRRIVGRTLVLPAVLLCAATAALPRGTPVWALLISLALLIIVLLCLVIPPSPGDEAGSVG